MGMNEPTPAADPLKRLLNRAAPALRALDRTINDNDVLRERRDALVDRVADAVKGRRTATDNDVEGVVVKEAPRAHRPSAAPASPTPAATPARTAAQPTRHFNVDRLRRMAAAAGREAIRPVSRPGAAQRAAKYAPWAVAATLVAWRVAARRRGPATPRRRAAGRVPGRW